MTRPGEVSPEGRAICLYLSGGGASTPIGKIGIGRGTADSTGYMDLHAEIGGALKKVSAKEEEITGKQPIVNLLVKRWSHYLSMVRHRNALKSHTRASRAAQKTLPDPWAYEKLRNAEEGILTHTEQMEFHRLQNEKLRRSKLYLGLMDVFREELRKRRVRV